MKSISKWRLLLLVIVCLAIIYNFWHQNLRPKNALVGRSISGVPNPLPSEGFCFNQSYKNVKLNTEGTIKQGRELYRHILYYRKKYGKFPDALSLNKDMTSDFKGYGFKDALDATLSFRCVDTKYSDEYHDEDENTIIPAFLICNIRPDGVGIGAPKATGKRDILAFSGIYYYRNTCLFPAKKPTHNPEGFYLVIWDNGELSKVAFDQVRYAYPQRSPFAECFPGQAGVYN